MGPTGFESYAQVRYLEEDRISQRVLFGLLRVHLADRTKAPGGCFQARRVGAIFCYARRPRAKHPAVVSRGYSQWPEGRIPASPRPG